MLEILLEILKIAILALIVFLMVNGWLDSKDRRRVRSPYPKPIDYRHSITSALEGATRVRLDVDSLMRESEQGKTVNDGGIKCW